MLYQVLSYVRMTVAEIMVGGVGGGGASRRCVFEA